MAGYITWSRVHDSWRIYIFFGHLHLSLDLRILVSVLFYTVTFVVSG